MYLSGSLKIQNLLPFTLAISPYTATCDFLPFLVRT
nr:MAG TPA: hypothetical protein [Caudoviricetes sp.]